MNRRSFLAHASAAAVYPFLRTASPAPILSAEVTLADHPLAPTIPLTFTGLSYELAQLTDPSFFSASNTDLVAHFRLLSPNGVLRIGGNTSEFCWFRASTSTRPPKLRLPPDNLDANWMPHQLFEIRPEAIDALAGFLQATGWRLIYGLNFGNNTPERAAAEAAYVASKTGEHLEFFQIGNEPDFYRDANNGTRPPSWDFHDYLQEWIAFAQAIAKKVPAARFGGPDVGASSYWMTRFGDQPLATIGPSLAAITGHYYAEGPPNDPSVTIQRLLAGNPKIDSETRQIVAIAQAHGRVYRMTEGNSCYRGGKPGMSDAFAAALWACDYMLQLASLGCTGVNLHGGVSAFLTAGLGGHTPGFETAKVQQKVRSGYYTPISSEPASPVRATPIFYGMLLANQLAGEKTLRVVGSLAGGNAAVYASKGTSAYKVAAINKDDRTALVLAIRSPKPIRAATAWRLQAPSLDSTEGVTLGGAEIAAHAQWAAKTLERLEVREGAAHLHLPPASAALVFLS